MSDTTAPVRRQNPQNLRFPGVTLVYQLYPGTHGQDRDRGIGGVHYAVYIRGHLWQTGETMPDGTVGIPLPDNESSFDIQIFGQRTHFDVVDTAPAALTLPPGMGDMQGGVHHASFTGVTQRLALLGYLDVGSAGTDELTPAVDKAILDFQVNEGFPPTGVLTNDQIARLQQRAGV